MNITSLKVNTDRMGQDIQSLQERLAQTRSHIVQIHQQMKALDGMWQGPAHDAYQRLFENEEQNMVELCNLFEQMIANLNTVRSNYDSCEQQVYQLVNALQI